MNRPDSGSCTYVACLTPPGAGAVACLALYGPNAWDVVRDLYRPRSPSQASLPAQPEIGRIWLGRMGEAITDEVVVTARRNARTPCVEVTCHGGREVSGLLQELFEARGVRYCSWRKFEFLSQDQAVRAAASGQLAKALTARTAAILLDQHQGAFRDAIQRLLVGWQEGDREEVCRMLEQLSQVVDLGRHLVTPWRVVIAGAPNVGKSSLVNALAGYQRCIVAETPGTTRDLVTTVVSIDGWPLELTDTAGMRADGGNLEQQGMTLSRLATGEADLCLWLLDASSSPIWPDFERNNLRFIANKTDLPAAWDVENAAGVLGVSARTGKGLGELCQAISGWLVPNPPSLGAAVPFTGELCDAIGSALHCYHAGRWIEAKPVLVKALTELGIGIY